MLVTCYVNSLLPGQPWHANSGKKGVRMNWSSTLLADFSYIKTGRTAEDETLDTMFPVSSQAPAVGGARARRPSGELLRFWVCLLEFVRFWGLV